MAVEVLKEKYSGRIKEQTVGAGDAAVKIGGETTLPFHYFEGEIPNPPKIAMEVYDIAPEDWAEAAVAPFKDVLNDPVAWAKLVVDKYGADMVCLQLAGTDPTGANKSAADAAELTEQIVKALPGTPFIVHGTGKVEKDTEVLKAVAERCAGSNLLLGPLKEENYRFIGAAAMGYKHGVIAQTPIDVNLAKQLNILLENLGLPLDKIVIDTTTGALGYGIEYTYSVMERIRLAALTANDEKLQLPFLCDVGKEAWKCKEARISEEESPALGPAKERGILWESMTALSLAMAGADILVMRHPESVRLVRETIGELAAR
ncbi:MAG: acetyl-CoA decarbonylase/synthase complex subunit delta [bacterium]|nr:acetyl-CoA decarbonylase/synthase complex subunit delta [bacterium]